MRALAKGLFSNIFSDVDDEKREISGINMYNITSPYSLDHSTSYGNINPHLYTSCLMDP